MSKYITLVAAYGVGVGINFRFHGKIANTLNAHRLIQHYQDEQGFEVADKIVNCKTSVPISQTPLMTDSTVHSIL